MLVQGVGLSLKSTGRLDGGWENSFVGGVVRGKCSAEVSRSVNFSAALCVLAAEKAKKLRPEKENLLVDF